MCNISGVYKITNNITYDFYIGSSKNIKRSITYIRKIIDCSLYNGEIFDEVNKEYIKVSFGGKFHPQIPHKLIEVSTLLKYKDGTYRRPSA